MFFEVCTWSSVQIGRVSNIARSMIINEVVELRRKLLQTAIAVGHEEARPAVSLFFLVTTVTPCENDRSPVGTGKRKKLFRRWRFINYGFCAVVKNAIHVVVLLCS